MKAGWKTVRLADVAEMRPPKSEVKLKGLKTSDEVGFIPMEDLTLFRKQARALQVRALSEVSNSYTYFANGDVLMAKISPCFQNGKMGIATGLPNGVGYGSSEYFVFRPSEELSAEWLFYFLQDPGFRRHATGKFSGNVGQQRLPKELIEELEIPLPPLAEQKRIVSLLDEAFAGIDEAKAKTEMNFLKAKAVFESHLQSALSNGNENWPKRSLEDLLNCGWIEGHLDGNHGSDYPKKEEFVDRGVPYISANCLQDEEIDMTRAKHLSTERAARLRKGIAKNNDVLFAHNATVGPVALLRTNEEKVILGTSLTYYRCNPDHIDPEYLAHYMRSSLFKRQYEQIMRQSTRNQIPITKQREFFHIIPPINEQRALVVTLAKLFEAGQVLCRIYGLKCSKLDELRHSLLSQAFAGELTA